MIEITIADQLRDAYHDATRGTCRSYEVLLRAAHLIEELEQQAAETRRYFEEQDARRNA